MPTSDWGSWLVDAIQGHEPGGMCAWYLGCNGLAVKAGDGTIAYVDPYLGLGDPPRTVRMIPVPFDPDAPSDASAVLVTHEHTDHLHGPTQGPMLAATGATMYAPAAAIDRVYDRGWPGRYDIPPGRFEAVGPGDHVELGSMTVGVHGCDDPDAEEAVTYRITDGTTTAVHAADGRPGEAMATVGERFDVDVAFVAFGSSGYVPDKRTREPRATTWYNDANDVIELADQLGATRLVPTHWDMWKGLTADPTSLVTHRRGYDEPAEVVIAEIGDRIVLGANN